ncbi:sterol desaturase/sphingolipid hydroxylase (fatty acid hydroxylase superfamily) [Methylovorus glucosotrophus]|uniref:sterol desaturase family protein n=1 Tax=Methylovorus glucosotrophus TaxID=266009 RepID=UPI001331C3B3|nr:sterol desaturase family protein [Methylovorus glucosotrophus]KAF0842860.1 sterol desaturase/sphingolipid hydroxylase (fatty acid hydroxylase superfamily) [Methylovorus glucosotrophus]
MTEIQESLRTLAHISVYVTWIIFSLAVVEAVVLKYVLKQEYDLAGAACSFSLKIVRVFSQSIPLLVTVPVGYWLSRHPVVDLSNYGAISYLLLFIGYEFGFYFRHRFAHQTRWFWISHQVHHSANHLNLSVAFRVSVGEILMGAMLFHVIPLSLLGFDPITILGAAAIGGAIALWNHSTWIGKLGPLEGILSTPSAHRVHHARNPEYIGEKEGANFGALTVIFDRIFGTYMPERDDIKIEYGLVEPIRSNNPVTISFHLFKKAWVDLRQARSIAEVVSYLTSKPSDPWPPVRTDGVRYNKTTFIEDNQLGR